MDKKCPIMFKCEDSLWQMMKSGEKQFERTLAMRRWDHSDDRIYRLSWSHWDRRSDWLGLLPTLEPDEPYVSFRNKSTDEILTFHFKRIEFTPWAPGWVFLILGVMVKSSA